MTIPLSPSPLGALFDRSRMGITIVRDHEAPAAPEGWRDWLRTMFPVSVSKPMAPHHVEFWDHIWPVDYRTAPRPYGAAWSREGGKSTNVECATVGLGVRGARRYAVYVRQVQDRADDSVGNIASKLESASIETYYPAHSRKLLSKFGSARGWRRNRVRTAGGFTVDAFGLDAAGRGAKIDDQRPDLIIFDDIDDEKDTPHMTAQKVRTITTALLPAGSENCMIIFVQNLIIADGVMTQLVDGRADFLSDRIMSGPHKAIKNLKWDRRENPETGTLEPVILSGTPTWEGQSLEVCTRQMKRWGITAFLKEAQHEVKERAEGLAISFDEAEHFVDMTEAEVKALIAVGNNFGGMDFGSWRFAFIGFAADENGVVTRWGEVFSQREELSVRAKRIHLLCENMGILKDDRMLRPFPIWGDAANPTDITEINAAWKRMESPLRVVAVGAESKLRRTAVDRINDKLGDRALRFVRTVGAGHRWLLGYNAGHAGTPTKGSRLMWEIGKWSFPVPKDGKVDLKQDPDDHTADGADMIAALRYALMSWWRPGKAQDDVDIDVNAPAVLAAEVKTVYTLRGRRKRARATYRSEYDGDE